MFCDFVLACVYCIVLRENEHEIAWVAGKIWEELREGKENKINIYYVNNLKIKMIKIKKKKKVNIELFKSLVAWRLKSSITKF